MSHTFKEVEDYLAARGCSIVEDGGQFALVYPTGYGSSRAAHTLAATDRECALAESTRFLNPEKEAYARIAAIKRVVAENFGTGPDAFLKFDRSEPLATARRIAIALCRELTVASRNQLRASFNREARGTIDHAVESVAAQCATDKQFAARFGALRALACAAFVISGPQIGKASL